MQKQVGNVSLMQKINRLKVLNYIRKNPDISRPMLAKATGLSLSSITNIVAYLIEKRLVAETGVEESDRVGRKSTLLRCDFKFYRLICIETGTDVATVAVADLGGNIIDKKEISIAGLSFKAAIVSIKEQIKSLMTNKRNKILAIGFAVSALVCDGKSTLLSSSMKWEGENLKEELEAEFNVPAFVENLTITKAAGQLNQQDAKIYENIVFADIEKGFGAVQVYKGEINRALIGEIGHTTICIDGEKCFCGNHGCLEIMCSAERVARKYNEQKGTDFTAMKTMEIQDETAKELFFECGEYMGAGLANLVNMLAPSLLVIIGGDMYNETVIKTAINAVKRRAYGVLTKNLEFKFVKSDEGSSIKGIAQCVCDKMFSIDYNVVE